MMKRRIGDISKRKRNEFLCYCVALVLFCALVVVV